jgi:hypothetical protein
MDSPHEKENCSPTLPLRQLRHYRSHLNPSPQSFHERTFQSQGWTVLDSDQQPKGAPDEHESRESESDNDSDSSGELPPPYAEAIMAYNLRSRTPRLNPVNTQSAAKGSEASSTGQAQMGMSFFIHCFAFVLMYFIATPLDPVPILEEPIEINFDVPDSQSATGSGHQVTKTIKIASSASFENGLNEICLTMHVHPANANLGYRWDNSKKRDPTHALNSEVAWAACLCSAQEQMKRARTRIVSVIIVNLVSLVFSALSTVINIMTW